ncbi:hypothetical protein FRC07_011391, partial [Ceratobasidium sp. 392]
MGRVRGKQSESSEAFKQPVSNLYKNALAYGASTEHYPHQASQEYSQIYQLQEATRVEEPDFQLAVPTLETIDEHLDQKLASLSLHQSSIESVTCTTSNAALLAPINELPAEILGHILALAQRYYIHQLHFGDVIYRPRPVSPLLHNFSRVCIKWRQLSLNLGELWSHIELVVTEDRRLYNRFYNRTKLSLERARGCPLHLYVYEMRDNYHFSSENEGFEGLLDEYLQQIASVQIWSESEYFPLKDFPWRLFGTRPHEPRWLMHKLLIGCESCHTRDNPLFNKDMDHPIFDAVSVLHLRNVAVPWNARLCHNLTKLQLENSNEVAPTLAQLRVILAANPGLRSLTLRRMYYRGRKEWEPEDPSNPVPLKDLEVLNLRRLEPDSFGPVLSMLAPGSRPLSMSILFEDSLCFDKSIYAFFERSNVTELYLDYSSDKSVGWWRPLPYPLRASLQKLAIVESKLTATHVPNGVIEIESKFPTSYELPITYPKLHTLHLLRSF